MTSAAERTITGPDLVLKRRFQTFVLRTVDGQALGVHATIGDAWRAVDEHDLSTTDHQRAVA